MTLLRRIKLLTLRSAEQAGLFARISRSGWRRDRLLILCYHGVSLADEHEWSDVYVSEQRMRQRFEMLRALTGSILPLDEALERMASGDLPPCSVTVTFDDGLHDFYAKSYPLLQEFEITATVYVPTYYSKLRRPIFDVACSYLLWRGRGQRIDSGRLLPKLVKLRVPADARARRHLHLAIRAHVNEMEYSAIEKDAMLAELAPQVGVDWQQFLERRMLQSMSPAEITSLDRSLVDVQLHTHRHRSPRNQAMFMRELDDNIAALEAMGFAADERTHFCYPSGDADPMFYPWLRARAISSATTCQPGIADRGVHPLNLPRVIDAMATTDTEFRGWVTGACALLPKRRVRPEPWDDVPPERHRPRIRPSKVGASIALEDAENALGD